MAEELNVDRVAGALLVSVGLLRRRLRATRVDGELTLPEMAALARLDHGGPATATALARQEQISPQSMGATVSTLEGRGLIARDPDPADGRRIVLSLTDAGRDVLRAKRDARTQQLAHALATGFTEAELAQLMVAAPLIERLARHI